jgi:hypothetical protein
LTGQSNHKQLAALLRKSWPGAMVEGQQVPPWSTPITFMTSPQSSWGVGLVGDHDVVLVYSQGDDPGEGGPQTLLEQTLRVREGMEVGMANQPSLASFASTPAARIGYLEGQVPDAIKPWSEFQKWFPLTPRHVELQITRDQRTKIQWVLTPVKAGDERVILDNAKRAKQQAGDSLSTLLAQHPELRKDHKLSRSLASMNWYMIPRSGSRGGAPVPPRGQAQNNRLPISPMAPAGPGSTASVGGTWTFSGEELNAWENLLKQQF